jgi:hypothetical protein
VPPLRGGVPPTPSGSKRGARGLRAPLSPRRPKEGPSAAGRAARPGARGCPMPQVRFESEEAAESRALCRSQGQDVRSIPRARAARRCFNQRVHILASACMNRTPGSRGSPPRWHQEAPGSGKCSQLLEAKRSPLEEKAAFRPDGSRRGYAACWGMPQPRGRRRNSPSPSARRQEPPNVSAYRREAGQNRRAIGGVWHGARCGLRPGSFQPPRKPRDRLAAYRNVPPGRPGKSAVAGWFCEEAGCAGAPACFIRHSPGEVRVHRRKAWLKALGSE